MSLSYEQNIAFSSVVDILEALDAQYAIWGGVAVTALGAPRYTQDLDVLLKGDGLYIPQFLRRLKELHFYVDEIAVERIAFEGGFFNVIHEPYVVKVDIYVPNEPHLLEMIDTKIRIPFDEIREANYISATSLIISKLIAFEDSQSTRHLDDIESVVNTQGKKLDLAKIDLFASKIGVFEIWRSLLEK